jgi:nitroimidazol reductase NimA-like FMN-containing flavoprotein (pyridoxamine 5'-phosphate oxidase superfamily)
VRQAKKEITDKAAVEDLLRNCAVGRLATIGPDGWPMVKPLNYVFVNGRIYFHTARKGEKIDHIRLDSRVCFETDLPIAYVRGASDNPCAAEFLYRSVIVKGRAMLVEDEQERREALSALMRKYQPEGGYGDFLPEKLGITGIVRIDIEQMTGKQDLGKEEHQEAVREALQHGAPRPIVLSPRG